MDEELVFQYLPLDLQLTAPFGILERSGSGSALILIRDQQANWVLGRKHGLHPEGIARMVGGGIENQEHPLEAAQRELSEETGLSIDQNKLLPLIHAEVQASFPNGQVAMGTVFVFYAQAYQELQPQDDIDQLVHLTEHQFQDLLKKFSSLPDQVLPQEPYSNTATWHDYGQVWGPIHAAALVRVHELGL